MIRGGWKSAALLAALLAAGCKEETKVLYRERIAILPDASGFLEKEVRADAQKNPILAILESAGGKTRELGVFPLDGEPDAKFRSGFRGDTVLLYPDSPKLEKRMRESGIAPGRFPIRTEFLEQAKWMATGTEEGSAIFFAPDKWKAYLDMSKGK